MLFVPIMIIPLANKSLKTEFYRWLYSTLECSRGGKSFPLRYKRPLFSSTPSEKTAIPSTVTTINDHSLEEVLLILTDESGFIGN